MRQPPRLPDDALSAMSQTITSLQTEIDKSQEYLKRVRAAEVSGVSPLSPALRRSAKVSRRYFPLLFSSLWHTAQRR